MKFCTEIFLRNKWILGTVACIFSVFGVASMVAATEIGLALSAPTTAAMMKSFPIVSMAENGGGEVVTAALTIRSGATTKNITSFQVNPGQRLDRSDFTKCVGKGYNTVQLCVGDQCQQSVVNCTSSISTQTYAAAY